MKNIKKWRKKKIASYIVLAVGKGKLSEVKLKNIRMKPDVKRAFLRLTVRENAIIKNSDTISSFIFHVIVPVTSILFNETVFLARNLLRYLVIYFFWDFALIHENLNYGNMSTYPL